MKNRFPWKWMFFGTALILVLVYTRHQYIRSELIISTKSPPVSAVTQNDDWPLPPPPSRVAIATNRPEVQKLPPVIHDGHNSIFKGWDPISLSLRVEALILQHPHPDIRVDLLRVLEKREIILNYQTRPEIAAIFQIIRGDELVGDSVEFPTKNENLVLSLNPTWLAGLQTNDQIIDAMLLMYHEFQHYKQWIHGDADYRKLARMRRDFERGLTTVTQAFACTHMWHDESPAYAAQCRLANAWGVSFAGMLCQYVDSPLWLHALFTTFGSTNIFQPCLRTFAELAGHPNPSKFAPH